MTYSICLPYYDPRYEKTEKFSRLIRSIVRNASTDNYELVIVKDGPSYAESHNMAMKNAKGDWLIIFNDDIEVVDPKFIEHFTSDNTKVNTWRGTAHAWAIPRHIFEKVGYFDERFKDGFNCEDTDYFHRIRLAGYELANVNVDLRHDQNHIDYGSKSKNRELFREKWGFDA